MAFVSRSEAFHQEEMMFTFFWLQMVIAIRDPLEAEAARGLGR